MSLWFLFFLSVLQGVTELFPISSLGHTLLVPALFGVHIDRRAGPVARRLGRVGLGVGEAGIDR